MKPWAAAIALLLILRYTGALSGLSVLTQSALLKSGLMDAQPTAEVVKKDFDYNFTVRDMQGQVVDMKQFKGKAIFLNLWATWCGPCRAEMPSIQNLYERTKGDKIVFIMLSLDRPQDGGKVVKYIGDKQFTFPVYVPNGELPATMQVSSIPTTFVVNPQGKIVSKKVGTANYDTPEFQSFLETL